MYKNSSSEMYVYAAFSAYASQTKSYAPGDIVSFDATYFNEGNHYNTFSSVFTCPIAGYYFIYGQFYNVFNEAMSFEIRKVGGQVWFMVSPLEIIT